MQEQWEHKMLVGTGLRQRLKDAEGIDYGVFNQKLLDKFGKEGWELCSHSFSFTSPTIVVFKRKINSV